MGSADLARIALELPTEERLDLACRLVESVVAPASLNAAITEGIHRSKTSPPGGSKAWQKKNFSPRSIRVIFHPEFSPDIRRFENVYSQVSDGLALRFRNEVLQAVNAIKASPTSAGHFLTTAAARSELRRRNLRSFPFFVLYGFTGEELLFASVIASRSDPLTWFSRFPGEQT
jgi:hypothetical protein